MPLRMSRLARPLLALVATRMPATGHSTAGPPGGSSTCTNSCDCACSPDSVTLLPPVPRPAPVLLGDKPAPTSECDPVGSLLPGCDEKIQYSGRWYINESAATTSWPADFIRASFEGSGIKATFVATSNVTLDFTVDNSRTTHDYYAQLKSGTPYVVSISNLTTKTPHEIMISRSSEGGTLSFLGFEVTGGQLTKLPPRPLTKYEFLGDSITCGLRSVKRDSLNCGDDGWCQNAYAAWGPQLARLMNADYRVSCRSGAGMAQNLQRQAGPTGSEQFFLKNAYHYWAEPGWDDRYAFDLDPWHPNVFFIFLGTNDCTTVAPPLPPALPLPPLTKEEFQEKYNNFVTRIFELHPGVTIIMLTPLYNMASLDFCQKLVLPSCNYVAGLHKDKGKPIHVIDLSSVLDNTDGLDYSDSEHPTELGATRLAQYIRVEMNRLKINA